MASLGHVALGLAARRWYERDQTPRWSPITSGVVWSVLSLLPDGDVVGFRFGVPYEAAWGHRGATPAGGAPGSFGAAAGWVVGHLVTSAFRVRVQLRASRQINRGSSGALLALGCTPLARDAADGTAHQRGASGQRGSGLGETER